mmetsp:Transcript_27132/g.75645  ORF Transcript_27132/g.75645 Transcript_27132/m.75645 type:complete len:855 (+) Transcript_27132:93-2657(+)
MGARSTKCCKGPETEDVSTRAVRRNRTMGRNNSLLYVPGATTLVHRLTTEKSEDVSALIASTLKGNPNIQRLASFSDEHLRLLVEHAWKQFVPKGKFLMHEGDLNPETFYVVEKGSFEVSASEAFEVITQDGVSYTQRFENLGQLSPKSGTYKEKTRTTRTIGPRTSIGEISMLYGTPRFTTVRALEASVVWAISQSNFKIVQLQAIEESNKASKADPLLGRSLFQPMAEKVVEEKELISKAIRLNANLQRLTPLSEDHIKPLVGVAWKEIVEKDQVLMTEGDLDADTFYIVGDGSFELDGSEPFQVITNQGVGYLSRAAHTGEAIVKEDASSRCVKVVGTGMMFGEISMLYCAARFATIRAVEKSTVWVIDRASFQGIQLKAAEDHMKERVELLDGLELARNLPKGGKEALAGVMDRMRFRSGEHIYQQGEAANTLYVLCEGIVEMITDGLVQTTLSADPGSKTVQYFGQDALVQDEPRPATIRVVSPTATAFVLERDDFKNVWDGLIADVPSPCFERYMTSATKAAKDSEEKLTLDRLEKAGLLGHSTFGPIELRKHKKTTETYALKVLSKGLIVRKGLRQSVLRERNLCMEMVSPFIIRTYATFNEPQNLYYLLEVALGGELRRAYDENILFGSVRHTQYYVAGVVLALEYLHRRRIVYRNIKPENVLLSKQGHPKIADMSLAKHVVGHTFTACGTPNYVAPDVLAGTGHTRAADWWSVGVLLFELMAGYAPFMSDHPMAIYSNIIRGLARVDFPEVCSGPVGELMRDLAKPQAIERLPMRQGGIANIKEHPWYANFDWGGMQNLTLQPPYVPDLRDDCDVSNFASVQAAEAPQSVDYVDDDSMWDFEFAS